MVKYLIMVVLNILVNLWRIAWSSKIAPHWQHQEDQGQRWSQEKRGTIWFRGLVHGTPKQSEDGKKVVDTHGLLKSTKSKFFYQDSIQWSFIWTQNSNKHKSTLEE